MRCLRRSEIFSTSSAIVVSVLGDVRKVMGLGAGWHSWRISFSRSACERHKRLAQTGRRDESSSDEDFSRIRIQVCRFDIAREKKIISSVRIRKRSTFAPPYKQEKRKASTGLLSIIPLRSFKPAPLLGRLPASRQQVHAEHQGRLRLMLIPTASESPPLNSLNLRQFYKLFPPLSLGKD